MPIDYSKFDKIDCDDEEDDRKTSDAGFRDILQQCMQQLDEKRAAEEGVLSGLRPGELPSPFGSGIPPDDLDIGAHPGEFPGDFGAGLGSGSKPLELEKLRSEAWELLLTRLVARPGAADIPRALLLDGELHLLGGRFRQALLAALALSFAAGSDGCPSHSSAGGGGAAGLHSAKGLCKEWMAPAMVIEMVAAYQLGDRDHAAAVRDRLKEIPHDSLSQHLQKRFEGTSEILELVPQFLNYLKAAEQEKQGVNDVCDEAQDSCSRPRRRR